MRNKLKSGAEAGLRTDLTLLPASTSLTELLAVVERLNRSEIHDGILVQSPLPAAMGADAYLEKPVDTLQLFEAIRRRVSAAPFFAG